MRPVQSLPRRSQLRQRWVALAAAAFLLTAQLLLLWRFAPPRLHTPPAWPASEAGFGELLQAPGRADPRYGASSDSRKRVRAVVGVQTGFNAPHPEPRYDYALRRAKLRESWFPADPAQLARWVPSPEPLKSKTSSRKPHRGPAMTKRCSGASCGRADFLPNPRSSQGRPQTPKILERNA